jgi:hypothetical protein
MQSAAGSFEPASSNGSAEPAAGSALPDASVRWWTDPDLQLERAAGEVWSAWRGGGASQQLRRLAGHLEHDDRLVLTAVEYNPQDEQLLALVDIDVYEVTAATEG